MRIRLIRHDPNSFESSNGAVARAAPSPHSKHAYQWYLPYVSGRLTAIRKNRGLKRGTARLIRFHLEQFLPYVIHASLVRHRSPSFSPGRLSDTISSASIFTRPTGQRKKEKTLRIHSAHSKLVNSRNETTVPFSHPPRASPSPPPPPSLTIPD